MSSIEGFLNRFQYTKEYHNLFAKAGVPPKRRLTRFFITPDAAIQPGMFHFQIFN